MDTKLTLNIDKRTVSRAKKYAKKQGRSLSNMVETYLKAVTEKETDEDDELSRIDPEIMALVGIVKEPDNFDYKKELKKAIQQKHRG